VPAVPVLTKQQAEHQAVIMRMVAEHRRRQEEELLQMVFRLNAAVQHQGGQVVSSEDAGGHHCGLTCDNLETLVYLHEVWPKTREWEARKKLRVV
jgi:hypothetical protein